MANPTINPTDQRLLLNSQDTLDKAKDLLEVLNRSMLAPERPETVTSNLTLIEIIEDEIGKVYANLNTVLHGAEAGQ
jgi:hypothetical protein